MFHLVEDFVRVDDPTSVADLSDPIEESSHLSGLDRVDSKVTGLASVYLDQTSISSFIEKYSILKPDANDGILAIGYCRPTNTICMGRSL